MDLRGGTLKNNPKKLGGPTFFGQQNCGPLNLGGQLFEGAETEPSQCNMGKQGPPLRVCDIWNWKYF